MASWPEDFQKIRDWQWNEKLIPLLEKRGRLRRGPRRQPDRFELHPGFCVSTPPLLRLREAVGPVIGANLDPPTCSGRASTSSPPFGRLKGAIYHFHAKDTAIDAYNTAVNGVLTPPPSTALQSAPGVPHDWLRPREDTWRAIFSELRKVGYDGVISIGA